jgi:hypothetical protein
MNNISFWFITLHNKGHFVPGWGKTFGSTYIVSNPPKKRQKPMYYESAYDLSRYDVHYLPKTRSGLCTYEENVEMTLCVYEYIKSKLGCTLPGRQPTEKRPKCDMDAQKDKYIALVTKLLQISDVDMLETTSCVTSCHLSSFSPRNGIHQELY